MTGGGFGGCTIALVDADRAPVISGAIDDAFAKAGFTAPEHFLATPASGAHRG
jgi:galactokinase